MTRATRHGALRRPEPPPAEPKRHPRSEPRSRPWATGSWLVAWVLGFAIQQSGSGPDPVAGLNELAAGWAEHPGTDLPRDLERLVPASVRTRVQARRQDGKLASPQASFTAQQQLDRRAELLRRDLMASALARWGVVPVQGWSQWGWILGALVFAGFWSWLWGLLTFQWIAPAVERTAGSGPLVALAGAGALIGLAVSALLSPVDSIRPIAGGTGAVAAVVGAGVVAFGRSSLPVVGLFSVPWRLPAVAALGPLLLSVSGLVVLTPHGAWTHAVGHGAAGAFGALSAAGVAAVRRGPRHAGARLGAAAGAAIAVLGLAFALPEASGLTPKDAGFELRTDPPGARIRIDETWWTSETPAVLTGLRRHRAYEIEVEKPGFLVDRPVRYHRATHPPTRLEFRLRPRVDVRVEADVEAMVWLDGRRLGVTPVALPGLARGSEHLLELTAEGRVPVRQTYLPEASETLRFELEPAVGVAVESIPWGRVFVDEVQRGETPLERLAVPSDRPSVLRIERPGYRTVRKRLYPLRLRSGQRLRFTLEPLPLSEMDLTPAQRKEYARASAELRRARGRLRRLAGRLRRLERRLENFPSRDKSSLPKRIALRRSVQETEAALPDARTTVDSLEQQLRALREEARAQVEDRAASAN